MQRKGDGPCSKLPPPAAPTTGSLIWVTLQRAKTAREAISTIAQLMADHGYASDGESFSIADTEEVWLMEIMSKGPGEKGAVWVATRIPEGYISSHANQARTTTFKHDDPEINRFADDGRSPARSFLLADPWSCGLRALV